MRSLRKALLSFIIFSSVVFILVTSIGLNVSMSMDKAGNMSHCPLMNDKSTGLCSMGWNDHLARWQQLFTATIQSDMFLFLTVLAATTFFVLKIKRARQLGASYMYLYRYYLNRHTEINLYNDLLQAFSDGVLHPKLYN